MKAMLKGFSRPAVEHRQPPKPSEVKKFLSTLKPEKYKAAIEEINLAGNYIHGTHVAGIAVAGNPYARLATARIEFDWHLHARSLPVARARRAGREERQAYVDFFKQAQACAW